MLGSLPLSEVRGPKGDLDEKLAGSEGEMWLTAFKRFLRKENPWMVAKFSVRWVVTLGLHKTPKAYEQALESSDFKISNFALDILKKVTCSKEQTKIYLTSATVAELGFTGGCSTRELHTAIVSQGGQLCPSEVGPALRLALNDQQKNEWLWLAMEAVSDSDGDFLVFSIEHDGGDLWLSTAYGHPDDHWDPDSRVVFVLPAQVS